MYQRTFKNIFDFVLSLLGLILFLPLLLFVAIFLLFANKGSPFFLQKRPGRNEKVFLMIKFKTMNDKKDIHGALLPDADRITTVGKIIRSTSIDELPQLINVLKGDMSLIGPRPLMIEYLPYYSDQQRQRHLVKPGITGWAQVNGRNSITWTDRLTMDVWYVDNCSLSLDLKIFFLTIQKVFNSSGISAEGHATMPKFSDEINSKNKV